MGLGFVRIKTHEQIPNIVVRSVPGTLRHKQFEAARTMLLAAAHIKPVTLASMSFYVRLEDIPQPYKPQPPSIVQAPTLSTRLSMEFWYLRESLGRDLMWFRAGVQNLALCLAG